MGEAWNERGDSRAKMILRRDTAIDDYYNERVIRLGSRLCTRNEGAPSLLQAFRLYVDSIFEIFGRRSA